MASLERRELDFPGSLSIAVITREVTFKKTGQQRKPEEVAYISNLLDPSPDQFLAIARAATGP